MSIGRRIFWTKQHFVAGAFVALAACIGSEPTLSGDAGVDGAAAGSDARVDAHAMLKMDSSVTGCPAAQMMCGTVCSSLDTDPSNCGACGTVCAAGMACVSGQCSVTCLASQTLCEPDGGDAGAFCANLQTDNDNCGACETVCPVGQACSGGVCASICTGATVPCESDAGVISCAKHGHRRGQLRRLRQRVPAGERVRRGAVLTQLRLGAGAPCSPDGGGSAYCASTMSDGNNCGACGNVCAAGSSCAGGSCVAVCGAGRAYCPPGDATRRRRGRRRGIVLRRPRRPTTPNCGTSRRQRLRSRHDVHGRRLRERLRRRSHILRA